MHEVIEHMKRTGEYGEFFPSSLSPFGYHETAANDYFPLSQRTATQRGFSWSEFKSPVADASAPVNGTEVNDSIREVTDGILETPILCEQSGRPFRITVHELSLYRRMEIPLPILHPDIRFAQRMLARSPRKLLDARCAKCAEKIRTTSAPERNKTVYCEQCYQKYLH